MSKESGEEKFRIEKVEVAGEISKDSTLSKSIRELTSTAEHKKIILEPYFCSCGRSLSKENVVRCSRCGKIMEKNCAFEYSNQILCNECLSKHYHIHLTKREYLILLCISSGIESPKAVSRISGISLGYVKQEIKSMLFAHYLTNEPLSFSEKIFPKIRLTDLGKDALSVFNKVYGKEGDFLALKQSIEEYRRKRKKYRLR